MRFKHFISLGFLGVLFAGAAFAQPSRDYDSATKWGPEFARTAARGSAGEVSMGRLAKSRASHARVREFAAKMINDHSRASDQLMQLAQRKGWRLPTTPNPRQQATARRLSQLRGSAFDRAYMQAMVVDRDRSVKLVRAYARSGSDPSLRALAQKALPVLMEHRRMARNTAQFVI